MNKITKIQIIIIILLSMLSYTSKAQQAPKYKQAVIVDVADYQNFIIGLNEWQRLCIHDPGTTADEKVKLLQNLQQYTAAIIKRYKADSILVAPDTTVLKPTAKKK